MLEIHSVPTLRSPALLCGFGGWADAASAATGALRYLLLKREGRRIGEFDPDAIYNYTNTRPITLRDDAGNRHMEWPELTWTAIEVPEEDHDLVLLLGLEPDLRWRECVGAIGDFATRLGISQVITFGGYLAQVHYAGPASLMGVSLDAQTRMRLLRLGLAESSYQGPTSFTTAILWECQQRNIPAAGLWTAAPSYLSNTSNPKYAAALLKVAERLLGQSLWRQELETAGRDMERRIADALKARPDLASFLETLESESEGEASSEMEAELEAELEAEMEARMDEEQSEGQPGPLPSAEEVLRDLEEHLRRLKSDQEDGDNT